MNKQEKVTNKQSCRGEIGLDMLGLFGDGRAHLGLSHERWNESNNFHGWLILRLWRIWQGLSRVPQLQHDWLPLWKDLKIKEKKLYFSKFSVFIRVKLEETLWLLWSFAAPDPPIFCNIIFVSSFVCQDSIASMQKKVFCYFISTY